MVMKLVRRSIVYGRSWLNECERDSIRVVGWIDRIGRNWQLNRSGGQIASKMI